MIGMLQFMSDYGGVVIGAIVLIGASFLLPRKARSYVLTGGLAILAFRTFQIFTNRKKLRAADEERERLRVKARELNSKLDDARSEHETLRQRLSTEHQDLEKLRMERKVLEEQSAATIEEKKNLDAKAQDALEGIGDLKDALAEEQRKMDAAAALWRSYEP